jgi:hypothetical protein
VSINRANVREALKNADFGQLFIEELGWDRHRMQPISILVEGTSYTLNAIAEKRGMVVFLCSAPENGEIPNYATRRKIEQQARRVAHEHLVVYTDGSGESQVWQWVRREPGRPAACREHHFHLGQPGDALVQKLEAISFGLDEEPFLTIATVAARARQAFDLDRVTKRFFERFQVEHRSFLDFIDGIHSQGDREWYASLMLNRLMFIYFIQKKGFLDGDPDYLRNRLRAIQTRRGKDKFHSFYRHFLLRLFHEGLGQQSRPSELDALLGAVPYLNGGLFDVHLLEHDNRSIEIADGAFEAIFDFFDGYQWHLDERPLRSDNEINPDVLGYIFEKYVNQRQMGAYYTKEDITEYIAKTAIIPFLFDAAQLASPRALQRKDGPWRLLRNNPDQYIDETARQEARLPTETDGQHTARRAHYDDLKNKIAAGDLQDINASITLNLDIRQLAQDAIESAEGPDELRAFYRAIADISVLDPTCGSGAFLFAALNVLEPLYEACLDRMQAFIDDGSASESIDDFRDTLVAVDAHPNRRYFILKSIIIGNLYGVDIMEEAVEICKLRLFLKLVAQVDHVDDMEPLPDIDFNIRAGNTLVGFASYDDVKSSVLGDIQGKMDYAGNMDRIDADALMADEAFESFRRMQVSGAPNAEALSLAKQELRTRLDALALELDRYLAVEYGIDRSSMSEKAFEGTFAEWRATHQPFHWFVEFYGIVQKKGGFDAVVGNPPYVSVSRINYLSRQLRTTRFSDIYAYVLLRTLDLSGEQARCGMIVPLSITFSQDFGLLREKLCAVGKAWFSSYDNIPASLFEGVSQRCTIWLGAKAPELAVFVSPMYRWRAEYRDSLIPNVGYSEIDAGRVADRGIPKLSSASLGRLLRRLEAAASGTELRVQARNPHSKGRLGFSQSARNFVSSFLDDPPCLDEKTLKAMPASKVGYVKVADESVAAAGLAVLAGEAFFWYWLARGDGFDVTSWIVNDFLSSLNDLPDAHFQLLAVLGAELHRRRLEALVFKKNAGRYVGNFNYRGLRSLTRRADLLLLGGLGLGRAEADEMFRYVERVLSINVFAGEKAIPDAVKRRFHPKTTRRDESKFLQQVDDLVRNEFDYSDSEFLLLVDRAGNPLAESTEVTD